MQSDGCNDVARAPPGSSRHLAEPQHPNPRRCRLLASTFSFSSVLTILFLDDPYYFMYFGTRPRIPSYFALEVQSGDRIVGRVLRFDSFSKIISAGIRIGFVTGPSPLLDAIDKHVSTNPYTTRVN